MVSKKSIYESERIDRKEKMKTKIQIKHFLTEAVLFEYECENNTIKTTLEKAVKQGADLQGADLWEANLQGADLQGADLRGANLWGANLWRANLREADLQGANLQGANLWGADLREADLRGANLWGANLWGANLWGAKGLDIWWHIHHEELYEVLTEPIRNRILYIKSDKPKDEQELRLKLLKPVLAEDGFPKTRKEWLALHKKECGCAWSEKSKTIFTKKNGYEVKKK